MERKDQVLGRVVGNLDAKIANLVESAEQLPASEAEYLALDLPERMAMAARIIQAFTPRWSDGSHERKTSESYPGPANAVTVNFTLDANTKLNARVCHDSLVGRSDEPIIKIWSEAIDSNNQVSSGYIRVGDIRPGSGTMTVFEMPNHRSFEIQHEIAAPAVEITDAAAVKLINQDVKHYRNLGGWAVNAPATRS